MVEARIHHHHHPPLFTKKLLVNAIYGLILLALLRFYFSPNPSSPPSPPLPLRRPPPPPPCDLSEGRWVPTTRGPHYNGTTCSTIKAGQNCMANGRPDTGYLRWRWQPQSCDLPAFDTAAFLALLRNKHLAFIGDSMARNQLESLLCLLSSGDSPPELLYSSDEGKFRRWRFRGVNATVSVFWSPFLVKGVEKSASADGPDRNHLYTDVPDERWSSELDSIDVAVFSAGHWFFHPAVFYAGGSVLGCHHCPGENHTEVGFFDVFRRAYATALGEVVRRRGGPTGTAAVVTTFSPAHFEGEWDKAGACPRTEPYRVREVGYVDAEMRKAQVEAVAAAAAGRRRRRVAALDVTRMANLRADGHPGPYINPNPNPLREGGRVQNDCLHWCLPGPIDAWNEILFEMMRRWRS